MTTNVTYTPWGWTKDVVELDEGVWRVSTPSHGGLKLSRERWDFLPAELRDAMYTQTFAEEDCEEPIVRTLLGIGDDMGEGDGLSRLRATSSDTLPCCPYLRAVRAGASHFHIIAYWGGIRAGIPFGRFDTLHRGRVLRR